MMAFFNSTAEPSMDGNKYEFGPTIKAPSDIAAWNKWEALNTKHVSLTKQASAKPELKEQAAAVAKEIAEFKKSFKPSLIARDLPKPRETKLLERGEYNLPKGEPLKPDVFAVMGTLPKDAPANRLGLAQWLTARGHPLVSRVLINRVWQRTFGEGLVRTPADFGLQGKQPTHPELPEANRRAKAQRKLQHADPAGLGGEEMAKFVHEDQGAEHRDGGKQVVEDRHATASTILALCSRAHASAASTASTESTVSPAWACR